jgi:radical SAM protein with 4Fe4S-binding SPASM domain
VSVSRLAPEIRSLIAQWCHDGKVAQVSTDYSGDLFWADHRFGGELDFFSDLQVPLSVSTNGVHMTPEASRTLLRSRVRWVNVSLDAGTDETFRRVRKGAPSLDAVVANMRAMAAARCEAGRTDVVLSIGFTLMRSNIAELPAVLQLCRDVGFDLVSTRHLEAYTRDMAHESFWFDHAAFNDAREAALALAGEMGVALYMPRAFEPRPERRGHHRCSEPWRSAVILGNGDVQVCCVPGPGMLMGNLHERPMEEIWNGPAYQDFRIRVNSANPPVACANCPMWRLENNRGSYLAYEWTN